MTKNTLFRVLVLALLSLGRLIAVPASAANQASKPVFRAGAAAADITPSLGETIIGGFVPFPATAVHDRLHARCLVLDNGQTQVALVICDNLGIARDVYDLARTRIAEVTELPPENILMAATHTHSATRSSSERYRETLIQGIVDAVCNAWQKREPARIGWGGVDEPSEVFNRRWFVTDDLLRRNPFGGVDQVRMNPPRGHATLVKPAGPIDPEISFVSVQSTDGRPLALLANYSLHYVGGVKKGDISADYFGIFSEQIGELLGRDADEPKMVAMLSNGTSGDVNNINFRERHTRREPYEKMTQVAELVASRVKEAHQTIQFHDWVPLGAAQQDLKLKFRKPSAETQQYFAKVLAKPEDAEKHHRYERVYAGRVQRLLDGPDDLSVPLQAIRIGDLGIAAIPFEVFAEIGLEIKDRSPFADTFTVTLANDSRGYLPTPRQHELGGYETWMGTCRVQLDASERIKEVILDLLAELKKE
jgi:hypothetical protein